MKKIVLLTISLFLIISMLGCPSRVNRGPVFVKIDVVDGEETTRKLVPLTAEKYNASKESFYNSEDYDGVSEFDYRDYYGDEYMIYEYERPEISPMILVDPSFANFDPDQMLSDLINDYGISAIDYRQDYVEIFADRKYNDISEDIIVTSFYDRWLGVEDANYDGVVDERDEALYDDFKTDEDGNYLFDDGKILVVDFLTAVGGVVDFTLRVTDEDGAEATISGVILITEPEE
jgi:hypothetical protein